MNTSKYIQLESEIKELRPIMQRALELIYTENISKYPIFVVHQGQLSLGVSVVSEQNSPFKWSMNISTLEQFVEYGLIENNKIDSFRTIYSNKINQYCLFVLSEMGAEFVFLNKNEK